jgi:hypothetical protein
MSADISVLKTILKDVFDVDIDEKSRAAKYVFARAVYVKVLRENGHSLQDIGNSINKNHATIINCEKKFKSIIDYYPHIHAMHLVCRQRYNDWKQTSDTSVSDLNKLEAEVYFLKAKVRSLETERDILLSRIDRVRHVQDITDMLAAKVPRGYELKVGKEINKLLKDIVYDL